MPTPNTDADYCVCPHCGEDLPDNATFCRECGASEESGWNQGEEWDDSDSGEIDDSAFDYDEFIAREFPEHAERRTNQRSVGWFVFAAVAVLLIAMLLLGSIR